MQFGKIVDTNTVKRGLINQPINDTFIDSLFRPRRNEEKPYHKFDIFDIVDTIEEGVVFVDPVIGSLVYKISSKKISQALFEMSARYTENIREIVRIVWNEKQYNYYIPDILFFERGGSHYVIYDDDTFFPILNAFEAEREPRFASEMTGIHNVGYFEGKLTSRLCLGHALEGMQYRSCVVDRADDYSRIFNRILSAAANTDLSPSSSKWRMDNEYNTSINYDFILRCLSNLSQKMEQDNYLQLLKRAQYNVSIIFDKVLELNDYSDSEKSKLVRFFNNSFGGSYEL